MTVDKLAWAFRLDRTGALWPNLRDRPRGRKPAIAPGEILLERLAEAGAFIRRYGDQASLDIEPGRELALSLVREFADRQAEYGALLIALRAPDMNAGGPSAAA